MRALVSLSDRLDAAKTESVNVPTGELFLYALASAVTRCLAAAATSTPNLPPKQRWPSPPKGAREQSAHGRSLALGSRRGMLQKDMPTDGGETRFPQPLVVWFARAQASINHQQANANAAPSRMPPTTSLR
jgi:hypothetical protein